jgi:hypothetical protein
VKRLSDLRSAGGLGAGAAVSEKDERLTENYGITIQKSPIQGSKAPVPAGVPAGQGCMVQSCQRANFKSQNL